MQTYLFYDIETTGLNKAFDQVLHFAAIRTDKNLDEIERYELKIKLNPDVIPAPDAMITHRMSLTEIAQGLSEYDAIKQIHAWMNTPGTTSVGYNTLGFDDEFLRFSFYRNLLAPYTHQYANQCNRIDIYPMTIMYYLYKPALLNWPRHEDKTSFKLELLNQANQFYAGRSHHAMVDVEVTLALARKLHAEREMWEYLEGYFNKRKEQDRMVRLGSDCALMIYGKFGSEHYFQSQVLSLGTHFRMTNQFLWLRLDQQSFLDLSKEDLIKNSYVVRKKLGEPGFLLPLEERFVRHLTAERLALARTNMQWLQANPSLLQALSDYHRHYTYPEFPEADASAYLYLKDFWTTQEEDLCRRFHLANEMEKSKLIMNLQNPLLATLAVRLLGRHFPGLLSEEQSAQFDAYMRLIQSDSAIIDYRGAVKNSLSTAYKRIAELRLETKLDDGQQQILNELEVELKRRFQ